MNNRIANIALLVDDYDEAIKFYTEVLDFELVEDTSMGSTKRFVRVKPKGGECALLLAKAKNEVQRSRIGDQTGGRVFLFLHTDDFDQMLDRIIEHQLEIIRGPIEETYGKVLVFADLYGNLWDLVEPR